MTNKIIIDGVDVSECDHYTDGECYFNYFDGISEGRCTDFKNCDHKQLQRKTAECEELKNEMEELKNKLLDKRDKALGGDFVKVCSQRDKIYRKLQMATEALKFYSGTFPNGNKNTAKQRQYVMAIC